MLHPGGLNADHKQKRSTLSRRRKMHLKAYLIKLNRQNKSDQMLTCLRKLFNVSILVGKQFNVNSCSSMPAS